MNTFELYGHLLGILGSLFSSRGQVFSFAYSLNETYHTSEFEFIRMISLFSLRSLHYFGI